MPKLNTAQKVAFIEAQSAMLNVRSAMYQAANRIAVADGKPPVFVTADFQALIAKYQKWLDGQHCLSFLTQ